jgi:hypothetical protein
MRDFRGRAAGKAGSLRRAIVAALLLPWIVSTTGCLFSSAKPTARVFRPPPVQAKAEAVVVPEVPILEEGGPPLDGPEAVPDPSQIAVIPLPRLPEPPTPAAPKPHAPAPVKATAPAPTPAPPKITQVFEQSQLDDLNHSYNEALGQVTRDLAVLAHRKLGGTESAQVSRIRTFEEQAKQEKDRDLVTAVELAKRAASLAEDLVSRVR